MSNAVAAVGPDEKEEGGSAVPETAAAVLLAVGIGTAPGAPGLATVAAVAAAGVAGAARAGAAPVMGAATVAGRVAVGAGGTGGAAQGSRMGRGVGLCGDTATIVGGGGALAAVSGVWDSSRGISYGGLAVVGARAGMVPIEPGGLAFPPKGNSGGGATHAADIGWPFSATKGANSKGKVLRQTLGAHTSSTTTSKCLKNISMIFLTRW